MYKKFGAAILVLLFLISIISLIIYIQRKQLPEVNIIKAVPVDAAIIIESNKLFSFLHKERNNNQIWSELTNIDNINKLNKKINKLDTIISGNENIKNIFKNRETIISIHNIGKTNYDLLFLVKIKSINESKHLKEFIIKQFNKNSDITQRKYNNTNILKIAHSNNSTFYLSFAKGIVMFSESSILIEDAIRQSETSNNLENNYAYKKVSETAGRNVSANIYINFKTFPILLSNCLNKNNQKTISSFTNFANWSELDLNLKKDAILLNGFTYSNDSANNYINIFLKQKPVDNEIKQILPSNTSMFMSLGISNFKQFSIDLKTFRKRNNTLSAYSRYYNNIKSKYNIDINKITSAIFNEEIALAFSDVEHNNISNNSVIIVKTKSKTLSKELLINTLKDICKIDRTNYNSLVENISIDKETQYEIFRMPLKGIFYNQFGSIFKDVENKYFAFIDNFIVFSDSKKSLNNFIHSYIRGKTLENEMGFQQFSDYLSSESNFYFYTNMFRSPEIISKFLNEKLKNGLNTHITNFKKFQAFAIQFRNSNNLIYNNLFLKYIPEIKEEAHTIWETHLDTSISFKPQFVINHYTQEKEIFIQDLNNKIYLINKVGRIMWKYQLPEKINSQIFQIDYFKNEKLQILFSTKDKIYLFDRNGNTVEKYPLKLRSPSTVGLSLFDYDNNKNYRIFIPCEDKKVYVYNIEGSILKGWNFNKTDTKITSEIKYFRINNKDYIVFADKFRTYILDRKGNERVHLSSHFIKSENNSFTLESANSKTNSRIVTTTNKGIVKYIYFNGKIEEKNLGNYSENHYFDYQDINSDGFKDFIFLDNKKLNVISNSGKLIYEYKFDSEINFEPIYFQFSYNDRKLGFVSKKANKLFLINNNGKLYNGFPLEGNTPFSIGYLNNTHNHFNLIVGNNNNFLYNYAVN